MHQYYRQAFFLQVRTTAKENRQASYFFQECKNRRPGGQQNLSRVKELLDHSKLKFKKKINKTSVPKKKKKK